MKTYMYVYHSRGLKIFMEYVKIPYLGCLILKSYVVRNHNGCIKSQTKYNPIPNSFEGAVVK